jgi:hypothetical protein
MTDLDWALKSLLAGVEHYRKPREYYNGKHPLVFTTEKFHEAFGGLFRAFADNVCPCVVETLADRLQVTGFTFPDAETKADETMREIWRRNRMAKRQGETYQDALVEGDAYVIVWPDAEGFPTFYPNRGANVAVHYDDEQPGYITRAAKGWIATETKKARVNVYYRERIEKYESKSEARGGLPDSGATFDLIDEIPNPFDKVPVFHFANRASVGDLGRSEIKEAMPLQDALNKSIADMLVAMEFSALPQRWATGLEGGEAGKLRPGGIWAVETEGTKFGDFATAEIEKFILVSESFRKEIARVTRTPLHYFTLEGTFPSGEAQRVADAPLLAKVADRQLSWGNVWADVARFALQIVEGGDTDPETVWQDTTPRSEREQVEIAKLKRELGVSKSQVLREIGYEDAEIEEFADEAADADLIPETAQ